MTTHLADVLAVAAAEFRQARRLSRTWLLGFLVVVGGSFLYLVGSGVPRFALPGIGMPLLWVLLIGVVFLAFDIRARDERERIAAALDTRPIRNIELLGGRLLGIALTVWLPLAVWALLLQGVGMLDEAVDLSGSRVSDSRVTPEPASLATFVFFDAPPALLVWGASVMLLAAALANRLVVCLVAVALLAAAFWALFNTPLHLLPVVLPGASASKRTRSEMSRFWRTADRLGTLHMEIEVAERRIPVGQETGHRTVQHPADDSPCEPEQQLRTHPRDNCKTQTAENTKCQIDCSPPAPLRCHSCVRCVRVRWRAVLT
ncbi:MAG: hypothetical protein OXH09_19590 [Gammaproteobacteria bacterium]|nr:hypothetical protein [Gammaproteobacteria bacterium]